MSHLRACVRAIVLLLLPLALVLSVTAEPEARLRTGSIVFSEHTPGSDHDQQDGAAGDDSAGAAVASRSASAAEAVGLDPLAYRSAEAWGVAPLFRLYVVQYAQQQGSSSSSNSESAGAPPAASLLVSALAAAGGSVLSYVPTSSLLVAALPEAAAAVQRDTGAVMVELGAEHRIAPECAALLAQGEASSGSSSAPSILQLRRLQGLAAADENQGQQQETYLQLPAAEQCTKGEVKQERLQPVESSGNYGSGGSSSAARGSAGSRRLVATAIGDGVASGINDGGSSDLAMARRALLRRMRVLALSDEGEVPAALAGAAKHAARRRQMAAADTTAAVPPPQYELLVELLPVAAVAAEAVAAAEADWPAAMSVALESATGVPVGSCVPLVSAVRGRDGQAMVVAPRIDGDMGGAVAGARLHVFVCEQHLPAALSWLAAQPVVRWVSPRMARTHRNARASILTQSGSLAAAEYNDPVGDGSSGAEAARRPYWAAGLDGTGEILGSGDTGVDLDNCYLSDPRYDAGAVAGQLAPVTTQWPSSQGNGYFTRSGDRVWLPADHRKLVQYYLPADCVYGDDPAQGTAGHGTHTAGTMVGALLALQAAPGYDGAVLGGAAGAAAAYGPTALSAASGAAPRAKLSFVDISLKAAAAGGQQGALDPPEPVDDVYLRLHYDAGARITSDSWGAVENIYDDFAQAYDAFLWRYPDSIAFIAAGNNGSDALTPGGSVGSPATAKNPVAVGATWRLPAELELGPRLLQVRGRNPAADPDASTSTELFRLAIYPLENPDLPQLLNIIPANSAVPFVVADPPDACTPLANPAADIRGAVVLAVRGECWFYQKVLNVRAAGGGAVIFVNNVPPMMDGAPYPVYPNSNYYAAKMAVSAISQGLGQWLLGNASAGVQLTLANVVEAAGPDTVAFFSSYGPLADGRIKPDVVAPGLYITSAGSRGGITGGACSPAQANLSGTSMATPHAAGHTALMRQYLRTGYYPAGSPADPAAAPFSPSGMLLKAMIIAGAKSLLGGLAMAMGLPMGPPPDGYQGWGRLSLAGSLPLPGLTPAGFSLQVADRGQFTASGQQAVLTGLTATGAGPVSIVLTWYDYPADVNSAAQLVNDLDLTVDLGAGHDGSPPQSLMGNNPEGALLPTPDRTNNVERVYMTYPPPGAALTITVRAHALPSRLLSGPDAALPQRWAVAVLGHFSGTMATELNPAYVRQGQMGTRDNGSGGGGGGAVQSSGTAAALACASSSSSFSAFPSPAFTTSSFNPASLHTASALATTAPTSAVPFAAAAQEGPPTAAVSSATAAPPETGLKVRC
ncbi:hypothetical protein HXX76_009902 [Chlamydomonas incerta]|uniref:Peptidase S8/S53 domain-containing protein n=1 Tax=Chlamydomonas incerta TaxID=51695 RepID=A0A835VVJ5_CHLIN|nr:hypothetical protein HXX76_009902 [Chlamydomonas incerta]|eukprot:KAG2430932.1 hypothetical protein HXX76_009902 [Chlamydomonas incerta]